MNKHQIEGSLKDFIGAVQQKAGQLTGNTNLQVRGAAKQVEGKAKKGVGVVEQILDKEVGIARSTGRSARQRKFPAA